MNRKGFTLIETIMVIAILALLMLILVPNVITMINKNNIKSCHTLEESIKTAAKMYVTNNKYTLGFNCPDNPDNNSTSKINVKLQSLVNSGNLKVEGELTNPVTEGTIDLNSVVEVTYNCKNKDFTYVFSLDCE